jgi:hypothetical protein
MEWAYSKMKSKRQCLVTDFLIRNKWYHVCVCV